MYIIHIIVTAPASTSRGKSGSRVAAGNAFIRRGIVHSASIRYVGIHRDRRADALA
jgi:hypothetical protein